jgi:hypothetical protein
VTQYWAEPHVEFVSRITLLQPASPDAIRAFPKPADLSSGLKTGLRTTRLERPRESSPVLIAAPSHLG